MTEAASEWWYLGSPVSGAARTHGPEEYKKGRRLASSVNDCEDMHSPVTSDPAARAAPDWDAGIAEGHLSNCEAENAQLRAERDRHEQHVALLLETNREQSAAIEKLQTQVAGLTRRVLADRLEDAEAHDFTVPKWEPVVTAARAFVEWHQKGQAGRPGSIYPMTWHDERDRRFSALAEAVAALDADA